MKPGQYKLAITYIISISTSLYYNNTIIELVFFYMYNVYIKY